MALKKSRLSNMSWRKLVLISLGVSMLMPVLFLFFRARNLSTYGSIEFSQRPPQTHSDNNTRRLKEVGGADAEPFKNFVGGKDSSMSLVAEETTNVSRRSVADEGFPKEVIEKPVEQVPDASSDPKIEAFEGKVLDGGDDQETVSNPPPVPSKEAEHFVAIAPPKSKKSKTDNSSPLLRTLRDQLITGKAYASLVQARNDLKLSAELKAQNKELQDMIADADDDEGLPTGAQAKSKSYNTLLDRAKNQYYDCSAFVKKLRAMVHATEQEGRMLKKQNTFLNQIAATNVPKGVHCLSMRLSVEYYALPLDQREFPNQERLEDPRLYHYALFSDNVLAASVVVNSTVVHAKEPEKHVFHVVTDRINVGAFKMWFLLNPPGRATIDVQNVDDFEWLNSTYSPVLRQLETSGMKEYYFKSGGSPSSKFRNPKYLAMLNHLRFYLPQVFPKLDKVLFLDEDVVVQKDLTPLWSIPTKGNVNVAVETCGTSFHRFDKYLNFSQPIIAKHFDPNACGWAYGMNIFDLHQWRLKDITGIYHHWQSLNEDRTLWKLGTLPPGLITFYNLTLPIAKHWHVLGLGYSPEVKTKEIRNAGVIHYNGNNKPWLEIAIPQYKAYWSKYVKYDHLFLQQCNLNP